MYCQTCKKKKKCNPTKCDERKQWVRDFMAHVRESGAEDTPLVGIGAYAPDQLCWRCKKAVGLCTWSSFGKPVSGWTAVRTLYDPWETNRTGWRVFDCPQYECEL